LLVAAKELYFHITRSGLDVKVGGQQDMIGGIGCQFDSEGVGIRNLSANAVAR